MPVLDKPDGVTFFISDGIFLAQVRAHVYVVKRHRRQSDELSEIEE